MSITTLVNDNAVDEGPASDEGVLSMCLSVLVEGPIITRVLLAAILFILMIVFGALTRGYA